MKDLTLKGQAAFDALIAIGLTDEAAQRMLTTAKRSEGFGPVNFPHEGTLYGLTYAGGYFTLGDADFSMVTR